jgi:hypothetical protein
LHLLNAQTGVWNLGEGREIRYKNIGGDYLNLWTLLENEQLVKTLFFESGYLICADASTIRLSRLAISPSLFFAFPPRDSAEWETLGENLELNRPSFSPDDFEGMLEQFGNVTLTISGANQRDIRSTGDGFRFVLNLQDDFSVQGNDILNLISQSPGEYIITYDGSWYITPLTSPSLRLEPRQTEIRTPYSVVFETVEVPFIVYNDGLEDAQEVSVRLFASQDEDVFYESDPISRPVLGGESMPVNFSWTGTSSGEWVLTIEASLVGSDTAPVFADMTIQVAPAQEPSFEQMISALGLIKAGQIAMLGLMLTAAAMGSVFLFLRMFSRYRCSGN